MGIQRVGTTADIRAIIKKMVSKGATPQQCVDKFASVTPSAIMAAGRQAAIQLGMIEGVDISKLKGKTQEDVLIGENQALATQVEELQTQLAAATMENAETVISTSGDSVHSVDASDIKNSSEAALDAPEPEPKTSVQTPTVPSTPNPAGDFLQK